jgi:hypothetical protein
MRLEVFWLHKIPQELATRESEKISCQTLYNTTAGKNSDGS